MRAGVGELDAMFVDAPAHSYGAVALCGLVVALAITIWDVDTWIIEETHSTNVHELQKMQLLCARTSSYMRKQFRIILIMFELQNMQLNFATAGSCCS